MKMYVSSRIEGEVGRFAVAMATRRDHVVVKRCHVLMECLNSRLLHLSPPPPPSKLHSKLLVIANNLQNVERILFDLHLLSLGLQLGWKDWKGR